MYRELILGGFLGFLILTPWPNSQEKMGNQDPDNITLFLCGDVMTGRGIDQVLPYSSDPVIYESYLKSALGYVSIAEKANGRIKKPVSFAYIWGAALEELDRVDPDLRIINLETSITTSDDHWKGKGINYRMHPGNIPTLTAAGIDFCSLANNHVLDWGYSGLEQTLKTLEKASIKYGGSGLDRSEAEMPVSIQVKGGSNVIVLSAGSGTSGIPSSWSADQEKAGVFYLEDFSQTTIQEIKTRISKVRKPGDMVVFSIHWGGNWGYDIPSAQQSFAHQLIDEAGVDLVHGHSSHHPRAIEIYNNKLIIYGAGDFLNDYEGISGYEDFRDDLVLMYFPTLDPKTGELVNLELTPMQIRNFRLNRISTTDAKWMKLILDREYRKFGASVELTPQNRLEVSW